ncbi:MAG: DNA cytosine methyltransferase [Berryella intestinalis]|uniref:DNA cytosine methyltransferase n=1 Tax=Berryella intestinalis TaxID=1531429 RepID=UPI002A75E662|nr:DNA cytosine methyltransferase [Berryella intestinalis]MDY3129919.1 DNA cytosine methyltransferase [Berryella intestinalis]
MRYVSVFSGIEAASCAWDGMGWEPVAFAEIDPFACAVLAHRFPEVPNLGDMKQIDWSRYRGKADLVVGGSPCQSFSVAGKREGLKGESGLMFEFVRCVREVRPRWVLWENVPGALSSEGGEAFGCLLRELADGGGYGLAWRVLDAQFFGVAQRRRRLFLVGRAGDGFREACGVLFEPDCLSGDSAASRAKRQELAADARRRARGGDRARVAGFCAGNTAAAGSIGYREDESPTLRGGASGTNQVPTVCIQGSMVGRSDGSGPQGCGVSDDLSFTLDTRDRHAVAFAQNTRDEVRMQNGDGSIAGALAARPGAKQQDYLCIERPVVCMADDNAHAAVDEDMCGSLKVGGSAPLVALGGRRYTVRRLTPTEFERLQGFPDGWTAVPYRGRTAGDCPDGPRYRALGNSMAVNVMKWIGVRIDAVNKGRNPDEACSGLRGQIFGKR